METREVHKGMNIHTRRAIAYVVLTIISFFCLFWFYILFVNATRSNGQLQSGFTLAPSSHLLENWKNLLAGTLPVWNGMLNSIIVAGLSALVSVYFSTMTAYAIHAYDFGLKKFIYPFILMIMMILAGAIAGAALPYHIPTDRLPFGIGDGVHITCRSEHRTVINRSRTRHPSTAENRSHAQCATDQCGTTSHLRIPFIQSTTTGIPFPY